MRGNHARGWRQFVVPLFVLLAVALSLAACGSTDEEFGTVGYVEGFFGGVAADEPHAAQTGRDVLSAGGSAADAVVAMYFVSAVTLPSAASLGGGGVCVGFDSASGEVQALEFFARRPTVAGTDADRPSAVPGNVRGFFAFHARYGRLRWSQLISPAENMARFGFRVSRALARDIQQVEGALAADPDTLRVFSGPDRAGLVREGDFLRQVELAAVLARVRAEGAGPFYTGSFARQLVEAAEAAGGTLSSSDLHGYAPTWRETVVVPTGNQTAHFPPAPAVGGAIAAEMWTSLVQRGGLNRASAAERVGIFADLGFDTADQRLDLLAREQGAAMASQPENPSAATFVAVDRDGSAAACAVTLNSLFGTGRVAGGTGIVLAAAPGPGGRGATALGPMLIVNQNVNEFFFAGAASGGAAAPTALISVAARAVLADEPLHQALAAQRALGGLMPDVVHHEGGASAIEPVFAGQGLRLAAVPALGQVNAVQCVRGLPPHPESCAAGSDPRGFGLSVMAD
jgi:gamma-glutamyltranspeptidase / glutathione hydrolase